MGDNRESGFINSQPCIAEFMTSVPHINQSIASTSINLESDSVSTFCQAITGALTPSSPTAGEMTIGGTPEGHDQTLAGNKYGDFAWMKDKKGVVRKSDAPQTVPDIGMLKK